MKIALRFAITLCLWLTALPMVSAQTPSWVGEYNRLLGKYVTPNGVRYGEWKKNSADLKALQGVVDAIATESASSMGQKEQLAFYINAYNAWILHEALEKYPTGSVKDLLFTFFTSKRIKVAGQQTSFKSLEDDVIRKKGEPRIHFALNCASRSCPPLAREAYEAGKLDAQLEKMAKGYINSENGVKLSADGKTAQLSKIFDWYKGDFKNGVLEFVNQHRAKPIPKDAKVTYQDYNWSLNEAK